VDDAVFRVDLISRGHSNDLCWNHRCLRLELDEASERGDQAHIAAF